MEGYKVSFNIFAESQEQADETSRQLGAFVDGCAAKGVAVSAGRILPLLRQIETSPFLQARLINYLRNGK
jgi:hypothetical protein